MIEPPIILAIESAIRGGSLALARGSDIIDTWIGGGGVSRAEDLLLNIDSLLERNHVAKYQLTQIVISAGPGSFTGIRIGLATAMGIASALDISLLQYPILNAMASTQPNAEMIATVVPVGRGVVCGQTFRKCATEMRSLTEPTPWMDGSCEQAANENTIITVDSFPRGLATCLINAANDDRLETAIEPLFIAKPEHI